MLRPMSDASLTNIRMVKPQGPKIFLGAVGLAAIGALAWWFLRPAGPVGEPEDPRKILIVGQDADVANTLRELGFLAEHGTFDALAAEGAKEKGAGTGIAAILHLADLRGIGYVALEDPASHAVDGLTVTADSSDVTAEHAWAVFSVGDLGMPPRVTVDAETSALPLPPYIQVLRAGFTQQRLANTLFAESQLPIDAVELYHAIKGAVDLHGAYAMLDRRVTKDLRARAEALIDAEVVTPKPAVLAKPLETSEVLALGDGTVLAFVHAWRLSSPRDVDVAIQPSTEIELWFQPPGVAEPAARKRCSSLRGGTLALGGTEVVASPQVDTLMLESESGLELWSLDVAAGACAFTRKGVVPRPRAGEYTWGVPHRSGRVLRPAAGPEGLTVEVWTAGSDRPESVAMPGCTRIGDPLWLDDGYFAVACAFEPPTPAIFDPYYDEELEDDDPVAPEAAPAPPPPPAQSWIYLARIDDPRVVAIPGTVLGEHKDVYTLHAVPSGSGLDLLAAHPWGGKLPRIRSKQSVAELFAAAEATFAALAEADADANPAPTLAAPEDPTATPATTPLRPQFVPAGAKVVALAGESFTVTPLELDGELRTLALSPDGTRVVVTAVRGHEVRVISLGDGSITTITNNPRVDHRAPRFTADGRAVAFTSQFDGNDRAEEVGQLVALQPPESAPQ